MLALASCCHAPCIASTASTFKVFIMILFICKTAIGIGRAFILASIKAFLKLLFHPYFCPFVEIYLEPLVGLDVLVRVFPLLTDHRFLNKQSCNTETRGRSFRSIKPHLPTIDLVRNCCSSINVISLSSEISILANQLANIVTDLIIAFALFMIKIIVSK